MTSLSEASRTGCCGGDPGLPGDYRESDVDVEARIAMELLKADEGSDE